MRDAPEPACLVIADISGYTSYLAGVELDHAQDILGDLMTTIVGSLRPAFRLAKLEGDAAFCYVITDTVDGSALMDSVERTYFAFRRRLRDVAGATTCECNACIRIPSLNLKILAHHGPIGRQRIAGREELVGSEVILAHRLLKNEVTERTGMAAYALYTDACIRAMGGIDPRTLGLLEHRESYEHIGEVVCWLRDLEAAWTDDLERTRVIVEPRETFASFSFDLPASPAIVWEYVTSPAHRIRWQAGVSEVIEYPANGRRGVGTTNHCMHGKDAIIEEIVDWRPTDYLTLRWQLPMPGAPKMLMTQSFEAVADGTKVTWRFGRPRSKKDVAFMEQVLPGLEPSFRAGLDALTPLVAGEAARRAEARPVEIAGSRSS
jgi:uncharacterized protein YndB with AHSA1/START domain